jgi:P4 family phage/plasmid primase-like protien
MNFDNSKQTSGYPIQAIKNKVLCFEYARDVLGLPVDKPGDRCISFRPGADNPTSLMVDERSWHDFGAAEQGHGDIIDLCRLAKHDGAFGPAIRELAQIAGIELRKCPDDTHFDHIQRAAEHFHRNLRPEDREYLHGRGIKDETIDALQIGFGKNYDDFGMDGRLVIPYWQAGKIRYMVGRALKGCMDEKTKYKKLYRQELSDHPIWGIDTLRRQGRVIIAEGIFDALSVYQEGLPVLTAVTGRFSHDQEKDLYSLLRGRQVTVCMDFDPDTKAGQHFTVDLAQKLNEHGIKTTIVLLEGNKEKVDLSDLYAKGENIKKLLETGEQFSRFKIKQLAELPDEDERKAKLQAFLSHLARVFAWPDVSALVSYVKTFDTWDKAWVAAMTKALQQPPSEDSVIRDLKKNLNLIYVEELGWLEYSDLGAWQSKKDSYVGQHISKIYGSFKTGSRIKSTQYTAQQELFFSGQLNQKKEFLNCRNGMLRFSDRTLLPHSQEYYSSIQLQYCYDPKAECPSWMQFLATITEEKADRIDLIQEMFGYCLTAEVGFHKCFFLLGEGGNGKSELLKVLERLVGEDNVSHVSIPDLEDSFKRIMLFGKLVNVTTEQQANIKSTEIFKQIIVGEKITGAHKHKDNFVFVPTVKFLLAANRPPEADDTTKGFIRRICFLNFPLEFKDTPDPRNPRHRQKIKDIAENYLFNELPGILNWALDGLNRLKANKQFTETIDQQRLVKDFVTLSSPLSCFVEERAHLFKDWTTRKAIYDEYKRWCAETTSSPMSARKFWVRLREVIRLEERHLYEREVRKEGAEYETVTPDEEKIF